MKVQRTDDTAVLRWLRFTTMTGARDYHGELLSRKVGRRVLAERGITCRPYETAEGVNWLARMIKKGLVECESVGGPRRVYVSVRCTPAARRLMQEQDLAELRSVR